MPEVVAVTVTGDGLAWVLNHLEGPATAAGSP
jgi:hypothetical protein